MYFLEISIHALCVAVLRQLLWLSVIILIYIATPLFVVDIYKIRWEATTDIDVHAFVSFCVERPQSMRPHGRRMTVLTSYNISEPPAKVEGTGLSVHL